MQKKYLIILEPDLNIYDCTNTTLIMSLTTLSTFTANTTVLPKVSVSAYTTLYKDPIFRVS